MWFINTFWTMFFLHALAIFSDFQKWITNIKLLDVAPEMFLYCFLSFPWLYSGNLTSYLTLFLNPRICPGMLLIVSVFERRFHIVVFLKCWFLYFSSELLYNLTADSDKRHKGLPPRVYFGNGGEQTVAVSQRFSLEINRQQCHHYTSFVRVSFPLIFQNFMLPRFRLLGFDKLNKKSNFILFTSVIHVPCLIVHHSLMHVIPKNKSFIKHGPASYLLNEMQYLFLFLFLILRC